MFNAVWGGIFIDVCEVKLLVILKVTSSRERPVSNQSKDRKSLYSYCRCVVQYEAVSLLMYSMWSKIISYLKADIIPKEAVSNQSKNRKSSYS